MPSGTFSSVQADIKAGKPAPVYLIVGDDERGKDEVVHLFDALIPEDIRPFNLERLSAPETDPAAVVAIARTYPLLGDRRVVVVSRCEKWLTSRRKGSGDDDGGGGAGGAGDDDGGADDASAGRGNDVLGGYVESPEAGTCLVLVAADINRTTKLAKTLVKHAVLVEQWGLKGEKELRGFGINEALERAQKFIIAAAKKAGMTIDRQAIEPLVEHAGTDIATLRGDVERVILYCHGKTNITLEDVRTIVSGATLINTWGVTNAIEKNDAGEAMRQLRLSLESGAAPYLVLGQLAWYVRSKLPTVAPGRVRPAVEAVFRTDLAMKSSGGEPKVLLERLVVELCGVPASRGGRPSPPSFRR
jgi:DNA polymerase III delta subunit